MLTLSLYDIQQGGGGTFSSSGVFLNTTYEKKYYTPPSGFLKVGIGIDRKFRTKFSNFYLGLGAGYRLNTPAMLQEKQLIYSTPSLKLSGILYEFRFRVELRDEKSYTRFRKFK